MVKRRSSLAVIASLTVLAGLFALTGATQDHALEDRVVALDQRLAAVEQELAGLKAELTRNHPDQRTEQAAARSLAAINAMLASGKAVEAKPALAKFMDEYGNTRSGPRAQAMAADLAAVGKQVPGTWQVQDWYQGDASDLVAPGATVVVFWETWCPHCRKALPVLQSVYEKYQGKGLSIVGFTTLSRGATDQSVRDFAGQNNIRFALARESGELNTYFGVNSIPSAAVIKNGTVIWSGHPAAISEAMVQGWLADTSS